jgi:hypothetical protein
MHVNRRCNSWRQKCDQERSREHLECKDLIIETECESNSDTVTTGATGTVSESLRQYQSNIPVTTGRLEPFQNHSDNT